MPLLAIFRVPANTALAAANPPQRDMLVQARPNLLRLHERDSIFPEEVVRSFLVVKLA